MNSRDGQSVGTSVFRQNAGNISIVDLPDDILIEIHKYLDLRNRFKMRLNRRLNQVNFPVLRLMEYMHIDICEGDKVRTHLKWMNEEEFQRSCHLQMAPQELKTLAKNTHARNLQLWIVRINIDEIKNNIDHIIEELCCFTAESINIQSRRSVKFNVPQINLSRILRLSRNVRKIEIEGICDSITYQDLSLIRKAIFQPDCMLSFLFILVPKKVAMGFISEVFSGVVPAHLLFRPAETYGDKVRKIYGSNSLGVFQDGQKVRTRCENFGTFCSITFDKRKTPSKKNITSKVNFKSIR